MQRHAGNRAVARLLSSRRLAPRAHGVAGGPVIQRNGSAEQLAKIAILSFPGPTVEVQDRIVAGLDREIDAELLRLEAEVKQLLARHLALYPKEGEQESKEQAELREKTQFDLDRARSACEALMRRYNNVTFIGAIVLTDPIADQSVTELARRARLVDLPPVGSGPGLSHSLDVSSYPLVAKARLQEDIITNTLATMDRAGQIDYLRKSNLIDSNHVVAIEVHYYRSRGLGETKFHKDTRGQTLFVNLNFTNTGQKILGPEYIVNPASDPRYDEFVSRNLPDVFVKDLMAIRPGLPGQKHIHATVVPEKGVVAFVDEAIHHKTPTPGHRTVGRETIAEVLREIYRDEYDDAAQAYKAYKAAQYSLWTWGSYLKEPAKSHAGDWWTVMDKLAEATGRRTQENRHDLASWLPAYFRPHIDAIIERGGYGDFGSVGYSYVIKDEHDKPKILTVPVKERGDKPLLRMMSQGDLRKYAAKSSSGRRSFFRTWVRAVPRKDL